MWQLTVRQSNVVLTSIHSGKSWAEFLEFAEYMHVKIPFEFTENQYEFLAVNKQLLAK